MNEKLFDMAVSASSNAYIPYDHFSVGAADFFERYKIDQRWSE